MYWVRPPSFLKWYYRDMTWRKSRSDKTIYLTFDDGPIPELTPFVLDILKKHGIKATFFCVGENIQKHSDLFRRLSAEGHRIGNHTYHHLKGWDYDTKSYIEDVKKCQELTQTSLFRPPYGKIKKSQIKILKEDFELIMWDVLSGDFDTSLAPASCYDNVIKYTRPGSILVFHDNLKAISRLKHTLPRIIEHFKAQGYTFGLL